MKKLMLSANKQPNTSEINYPVLVSGKLDGVRGCVQNGTLVSRSLKESHNRHVAKLLGNPMLDGLDGELCLPGKDFNDFNKNQSAFMTQSGEPKFVFHVFDDMSQDMVTYTRKLNVSNRVDYLKQHGFPVEYCTQHMVFREEELLKLYDDYRDKGYEGLIIMDPKGLYKHGRSTLNQGISLKLKPCEDSEAVITGFEVVQHNMDAGNSKKKENLYDGVRAGKIIAKWGDQTIYIGTGFDHDSAWVWWNNPEKFIGQIVKFKYMELTPYGMPRCPVFLGIRSPEDMS